jgi:hypothetical protein
MCPRKICQISMLDKEVVEYIEEVGKKEKEEIMKR